VTIDARVLDAAGPLKELGMMWIGRLSVVKFEIGLLRLKMRFRLLSGAHGL